MDIKLVMFKADGERREFAITHPVTIIGRKHTCDLRVPISSVSREHCQVEMRDDGCYIRDLGSSNGTFYNDQRVSESLLGAGDTIVVGPVHFTVVIDGEPADIEPIATVIPGGAEVEEHGAVPAAPAPAGGADDPKPARASTPAEATAGASDEDEDDFREDSALEIVAEDTFDDDEPAAPPPPPKPKPAPAAPAPKPARPASPVKPAASKGRPAKPAEDEVTTIDTESGDDDDAAAVELIADDEPKANTDDALAALMSGKKVGGKGPASGKDKPTAKKPAAKEPAFDADDPISALEALANAEGGPATDDDALAWLEDDEDDKD